MINIVFNPESYRSRTPAENGEIIFGRPLNLGCSCDGICDRIHEVAATQKLIAPDKK